MMRRMPVARLVPIAGACAALLAGCAAGPDFQPPAPVADQRYTPAPQPTGTVEALGAGGAAQRFVPTDEPGGGWWHSFGSPELDRLVQDALDASPTLAQATLRLAQAREDYRAQTGTLWPQVDVAANATREQLSTAAIAGGTLLGNRTIPPFTLLQANVNVSYSLDLSGADRRTLEGLAALVDYQAYELDAARLTLAGNVVTSAVQRASLAAQIDLSERLLDLQMRQLGIAEDRLRAGGVAEADVLSQRAQVEQTRAAIPPLRRQVAEAEHQLAVYLGRTPAQGTPTLPALDALVLPTELPLTLPSALARQRPDIRAAEALLHQASANVGVATANLYPQVTLTGSFGRVGTTLSDMTSVWAIGAGLTQPIFNGGTLRARQRAAQDAYEAALASYRQTVLQGLQQVANALRALEHDAAELDARDRAQRDAAGAAGVARLRHDAGGVSLLSLLDAQRQELQTALDRTKVQAQRLSDTAALYQALGARP
jgi:NodT family efflux transporter outer membrane factor (OMF) lipoprotein